MSDEHDVLPDVDALRLGTPSEAPEITEMAAHAPSLQSLQADSSAAMATDDLCAEPEAATVEPPTPTPRPTPEPAWALRRPGRRASPYRPQTPEQKAEFEKLWLDRTYTLEDIGRLYGGVNKRTVEKWATAFRLPPRDMLSKGATRTATSVLKETEAVAEAMTRARATAPAFDDPQSNPLADPEIAQALAEIEAEALAISPHSNLTSLQRKLSRLAVLIATKAPIRSWPSLQVSIESLSRAMLHARKVEAELPPTGADHALLRKEAAAQMMKELKSVLSVDEQAELARLVKVGADRLMARQK